MAKRAAKKSAASETRSGEAAAAADLRAAPKSAAKPKPKAPAKPPAAAKSRSQRSSAALKSVAAASIAALAADPDLDPTTLSPDECAAVINHLRSELETTKAQNTLLEYRQAEVLDRIDWVLDSLKTAVAPNARRHSDE